MELPKSLLGAILLGVTVSATAASCTKPNLPTPGHGPVIENGNGGGEVIVPQTPHDCPACGMG